MYSNLKPLRILKDFAGSIPVIPCPKCKTRVRYFPRSFKEWFFWKRRCSGCGTWNGFSNPAVFGGFVGLMAAVQIARYWGIGNEWARLIIVVLIAWLLQPVILKIFGKRQVIENESEDTAQIRSWKRVRSISLWVGPAGFMFLMFGARFQVHQYDAVLKNNGFAGGFNLTQPLGRLFAILYLNQVVGVITIVAIIVFLVASSKVNRINYPGSGHGKTRVNNSPIPKSLVLEYPQGVVRRMWLITILTILFFLILLLFLPFHNPVLLVLSILGLGGCFLSSRHPYYQVGNFISLSQNALINDDFARAETFLSKSYRLMPNEPAVIRPLIYARYCQHKYDDETIKYLTELLSMKPEIMDMDTQLVLAHCYCATEKYDLAIPILQKIPETYFQYTAAIAFLGECFYRQKKYYLAVESLKKAPLQERNLDENLMAVHYLLGLNYEALGDEKNALKHYRRVYAEDVNFKGVKEALQRLEKKVEPEIGMTINEVKPETESESG